MLKVQGISKSYGSIAALSDVSFSLERGQKVALVGYNGTGKSTLLKILAGIEEADSGVRAIGESIKIGYLPQDTSLVREETVVRYLKRISGIGNLEQEMTELSAMANNATAQKRYAEIEAAYEQTGGYTFPHRMSAMLTAFGLDEVDEARSLSSLSSGQKSKVALVGILLMDADLLLLDEPTNNLDLPAVIWLEDFLKTSEAAAIVVSHDRRFLDQVTTKVLELSWKTHALTVTNGSYTDYLTASVRRRARQKEAYFLQQEEVQRLLEQARQLKQRAASGSRWPGRDNDKYIRGFKRDRAAKSAKGAKVLEKRVEQMERIEKPPERELFEIPLGFEKEHQSCNIHLCNLIAGYPGGFVIGPISMEVKFGSRIAILGLNGSGKSTLLKTISGYIPAIAGEVQLGAGVILGNMMQEHDSLPRESTLLDYVMKRAGVAEQGAYAILGKFNFNSSEAKGKISSLSPGGRARLLLALFSVFTVNTLILDEPTNHLDLEAMEALEEALQSYQGTVIMVSHDRYFLEKISPDEAFLMEQGAVKKLKNYHSYIASAEKKARRLLRIL